MDAVVAFEPVAMPPEAQAFRREIREFLAAELPSLPGAQRANSWVRADPSFSRKLGARGWIGLVWPRQYGGAERSALERFVLLEELLVAGAPVGAHWIADRQSGPALLRYGSEAQRQKYLPGMIRGEEYCCIGMSEPNAGSDLAAVKTRARRRPDGRWVLTGQKLWTSGAQRCRTMIALARTAEPDEQHRHAGLSQFLVELASPGVRVVPIRDLTGAEEFNEVFFDEAIVAADALLGHEGDGWPQLTRELALERSGPERYLSSHALFTELITHAASQPRDATRQLVGRVTAELWTLRQMSLSIAGQLAAGKDPALQAAIVKDLGNSFEQALPAACQALLDENFRLEADTDLARTLGYLLQVSPSFSLRGGTREILRGIIARGLGLR